MSVARFVSRDLQLRCSIVDATHVVREAQKLHLAEIPATVAIGQAMMGALLMASHLKDGQMVGLLFQGDGPLGNVFAEASYSGQVRAFIDKPTLKGGVELANLGDGYLTVSRQIPFQRQPYNGTVKLLTGDIQDDLMFYLLQSQQIRSLTSLSVSVSETAQLQKAAGMLVEAMPGAEEDIFQKLLTNARNQPPLTDVLLKGMTPVEAVAPYFSGIEYVQLDHDYPIAYTCRCDRDRVETMLSILGKEELESMVTENEDVEIKCQMCGQPYLFSPEDLVDLLKRLAPDHAH